MQNGDVAPLVKVGNEILFRENVMQVLYSGLSPEDSIIMSEHYIRSWINEQLLFEVASQNINNKEEIEKLVQNYRRSLIIHQYQEHLINEKLENELNEELLLGFYEENKDHFKLEKTLIRGLFLKIPQGAPQIENIRTRYKSLNPDNIEKIEKYSIQNSAVYDYFVDQWIDFNEFMNSWPQSYRDENNILKHNRYIEQQDSVFHYFLNVTDYLLPGSTAPFEYTKSVIREMLLNQRKNDFLKKTEEDLYRRALSRGQIQFFNE
jgi:hypothetical protein